MNIHIGYINMIVNRAKEKSQIKKYDREEKQLSKNVVYLICRLVTAEDNVRGRNIIHVSIQESLDAVKEQTNRSNGSADRIDTNKLYFHPNFRKKGLQIE